MKDAFSSDPSPASEGLCSRASSTTPSGEATAVPAWDSAEALEEIRRLVAAGLTTRQIGARWGVSRNAVQKRLGRQREKAWIGVKQDASLPNWRSEEACAAVLRLRREGRKPLEIARLFGVSASMVFKRLSALPEDYEPKRRAPVPEVVPEWDSEDAAKVAIDLRAGGWSQAEIGALFGVTGNAVGKRFRRLAAGDGEGRASKRPASAGRTGPASRGGVLSRTPVIGPGGASTGADAASAPSNVGSVPQDLAKLPQATPGALPSRDSPDIDAELRRLHGAGLPLTEIARRLGVARSTLRDRLARLKITREPDPLPRQEPGEREGHDPVERGAAPAQDLVAKSPLDMASLLATSGCRWPMWGNDERPTHIYCGRPALRTRWPGVYCEDCRARAFRRIAVMAEM